MSTLKGGFLTTDRLGDTPRFLVQMLQVRRAKRQATTVTRNESPKERHGDHFKKVPCGFLCGDRM